MRSPSIVSSTSQQAPGTAVSRVQGIVGAVERWPDGEIANSHDAIRRQPRSRVVVVPARTTVLDGAPVLCLVKPPAPTLSIDVLPRPPLAARVGARLGLGATPSRSSSAPDRQARSSASSAPSSPSTSCSGVSVEDDARHRRAGIPSVRRRRHAAAQPAACGTRLSENPAAHRRRSRRLGRSRQQRGVSGVSWGSCQRIRDGRGDGHARRRSIADQGTGLTESPRAGCDMGRGRARKTGRRNLRVLLSNSRYLKTVFPMRRSAPPNVLARPIKTSLRRGLLQPPPGRALGMDDARRAAALVRTSGDYRRVEFRLLGAGGMVIASHLERVVRPAAPLASSALIGLATVLAIVPASPPSVHRRPRWSGSSVPVPARATITGGTSVSSEHSPAPPPPHVTVPPWWPAACGQRPRERERETRERERRESERQTREKARERESARARESARERERAPRETAPDRLPEQPPTPPS